MEIAPYTHTLISLTSIIYQFQNFFWYWLLNLCDGVPVSEPIQPFWPAKGYTKERNDNG